MENKTILEEIESAILEENQEVVKADLKAVDYPKYLDDNTIKMSLADFLTLYESNKQLNRLVDEIIQSTELTYSKEELKVDSYNSERIARIVKEVSPLAYVERYEELLEGK